MKINLVEFILFMDKICNHCNSQFKVYGKRKELSSVFCSINCKKAATLEKPLPVSKKCSCCKQIKNQEHFYIVNYGNTTRKVLASYCKECSIGSAANYSKNFKKVNGYCKQTYLRSRTIKDYLAYLLVKSRTRATKKKMQFDIDIDFLLNLWETQEGLCKLTKDPMTYILGKGIVNNNASLDRIDSTKGYTKDNVVLTTTIANRLKQSLSITELIKICTKIINNYG